MKHFPWYVYVIGILGPSVIFMLIVIIRWQVLEWIHRNHIDGIKKIKTNGAPFIAEHPTTKKLNELNRGQRRRLLKIQGKNKQSLSSKLQKEKGQIMEAKDFLKKYGIDKKFFDGK